jgi:hypothetical protein
MVKQPDPPTNNEIRMLLGDAIVDSWTQDKVTWWLEDKGWGQFASTFESKFDLFSLVLETNKND